MRRSRDSRSLATRARCCMSSASGWVCELVTPGVTRAKTAPETVSIRTRATRDSMRREAAIRFHGAFRVRTVVSTASAGPAAEARRPRDRPHEHLEHERVGRVRRERRDTPAPGVHRCRRRRPRRADPAAGPIEEVHIARRVRVQCAGRRRTEARAPGRRRVAADVGRRVALRQAEAKAVEAPGQREELFHLLGRQQRGGGLHARRIPERDATPDSSATPIPPPQ